MADKNDGTIRVEMVTTKVVDGCLLETVYDFMRPDEARLAWRLANGEIGIGEGVTINGTLYIPYPIPDELRTDHLAFAAGIGQQMKTMELVNKIEWYISSAGVGQNSIRLISYWILMSWVSDCYPITYYLRLLGPEGGEKTDLYRHISMLAYHMILGVYPLRGALFANHAYGGTMEIDMDTSRNQCKRTYAALKFICEAGFVRGYSSHFGPENYQIYGPKIILMEKALRKTASNWMFEERMRTNAINIHVKSSGYYTERALPLETIYRGAALRDSLMRWRLDHWKMIEKVGHELGRLEFDSKQSGLSNLLLPLVQDEPEAGEDLLSTIDGWEA